MAREITRPTLDSLERRFEIAPLVARASLAPSEIKKYCCEIAVAVALVLVPRDELPLIRLSDQDGHCYAPISFTPEQSQDYMYGIHLTRGLPPELEEAMIFDHVQHFSPGTLEFYLYYQRKWLSDYLIMKIEQAVSAMLLDQIPAGYENDDPLRVIEDFQFKEMLKRVLEMRQDYEYEEHYLH